MIIIKDNIPESIGIIMDGNGRWAKKRALPTIMGHREGANTLKKIVEYANEIGVEYLIVYAFSTENWKRSKEEVNGLMSLLTEYLDSFEKNFYKQNIRIKVIGRRSLLLKDLQEKINNVEQKTSNNRGLTFVIALDYGGRQEMVTAMQRIAKRIENGEISIDEITEDIISNNLYTRDIKDPDIIIRTSGEQRLSNFLMWQGVYSELYFTDVLWPDFRKQDLDIAIRAYSNRNRRFGGR